MKKPVWQMKAKASERVKDIQALKEKMGDTAPDMAITAHRILFRDILRDMHMEDCRLVASIRIKKQFPKCSVEKDMTRSRSPRRSKRKHQDIREETRGNSQNTNEFQSKTLPSP